MHYSSLYTIHAKKKLIRSATSQIFTFGKRSMLLFTLFPVLVLGVLQIHFENSNNFFNASNVALGPPGHEIKPGYVYLPDEGPYFALVDDDFVYEESFGALRRYVGKQQGLKEKDIAVIHVNMDEVVAETSDGATSPSRSIRGVDLKTKRRETGGHIEELNEALREVPGLIQRKVQYGIQALVVEIGRAIYGDYKVQLAREFTEGDYLYRITVATQKNKPSEAEAEEVLDSVAAWATEEPRLGIVDLAADKEYVADVILQALNQNITHGCLIRNSPRNWRSCVQFKSGSHDFMPCPNNWLNLEAWRDY